MGRPSFSPPQTSNFMFYTYFGQGNWRLAEFFPTPLTICITVFPDVITLCIRLMSNFVRVGKNWAGAFFPHPYAGGYLGGEKLGWSVIFPPWQMKTSILPCHEYANNLCILGGGEKLGRPILSPPWLVCKYQSCADARLYGGEKLGWSVIFPPWQVKISTLPCHEYADNLCLLGGGEKLGQPILSPPW